MVAAYLSPDEILVYSKDEDNYRCIVMGLFLHFFFLAQFSWMMTQVLFVSSKSHSYASNFKEVQRSWRGILLLGNSSVWPSVHHTLILSVRYLNI